MSGVLGTPDRSGPQQAITEELEAHWARLDTLLSSASVGVEDFSEAVVILSNVAHAFVYLEGNQRSLDHTSLRAWHDRFHANRELDERLLDRFRRARFQDPAAEELRQAHVGWWEARVQGEDGHPDEELEGLHAQAKRAADALRRDRRDLLRRLGVAHIDTGPEAAFHRVISEAPRAGTRSKLAHAWRKLRESGVAVQADAIDSVIDRRRILSASQGIPSVLHWTLRRSNLTEEAVRDFVERYLMQALRSSAALADGIRALPGCADPEHPFDHFGHYLRTQVNGARLPLFSLEDCLEYAFEIAEKVHGLTMARRPAWHPDVFAVCVKRLGDVVGEIRFDLLPTGRIPAGEGRSRPPDQAKSGQVRRVPVGRVLCRFQPSDAGARLVNFEGLHSVLHEFGHALNHILLSRRVPGGSGMDYLPLERLEDLSMWWEKWVYHPDLASFLELGDEERAGLELCRRVKMMEFQRSDVDRAVVAALDLDLHSRQEGGIRDAFERLDKRLGVARECDFSDLLGYFSWPMFRLNPGAGFMYLWGSAYSAQMFLPFLDRGLAELGPPDGSHDVLRTCFDVDAPSKRPDVTAVPSFYDLERAP